MTGLRKLVQLRLDVVDRSRAIPVALLRPESFALSLILKRMQAPLWVRYGLPQLQARMNAVARSSARRVFVLDVFVPEEL